ncbi:MAG: hypothetical protein Kow0029_16280 [Candidatus Rifleibacteriota bacterium]
MIEIKTGRRQGSAIITAIGMGIVLMFVIIGIHTFSSYRIQTTIQSSRKAKALAIAEAGIELALAEMSYNYGFETHKVSKDLKWLSECDNRQVLANVPAHGLEITRKTRGTYQGKLGDGEFRVRVGNIPFKDDDKTVNIDESHSFVLIDSYGKYFDTVKKVRVVVERRYPAREFLMYDGGFLSLVYGEPAKNNKNVFSTGHLYGHAGIEIGRILMTRHMATIPGTDQELDNMNAIISGAGGIFFFSPIKTKFREKNGLPEMTTTIAQNAVFPTGGTYSSPDAEKFGEYPKEMRETTPPLPDNLKPWIKDKHAGISIPPKPVPFAYYKSEAKKAGKGLYFQAGFADSRYARNYKVPNGWTGTGNNRLKSILLDFGDNIRPGNVQLPADFNGMIFAEDHVVIKGNPPKDIHIVTPKNVFVAGDFNQAGDPNLIDETYGMPQDYESNALKSNDYRDSVKSRLLDDAKTTGFRNHVSATVIAGERIVYDYRSPIDCFENELYPFMKYKLATYIADETKAQENCLEHNKTGTLETNATSEEEFENALDNYFNDYKIDGTVENSLKNEFKDLYNNRGGKFSFDDYDQICRKIWKEYAEKYDPEEDGELSDAAKSLSYGPYKLLKDLRAKLGVPADGDADNFSPDVIDDKPGDFLYFPEMTTNAMFISCGKRNNLFYAGPDFIKIYNEIGRSDSCVASNIGLKHSKMMHMVHRVYGSEINLRLNDVHRITSGYYEPPTRRKLYDESLPVMGLANSKYEIAGYVVCTWRDTIASLEEYENFE